MDIGIAIKLNILIIHRSPSQNIPARIIIIEKEKIIPLITDTIQ